MVTNENATAKKIVNKNYTRTELRTQREKRATFVVLRHCDIVTILR